MPNHVENFVTFSGDDALAVVELMTSEESAFDFNRIIPMPAELRRTHSGFQTIDGVECTVWEEVPCEKDAPGAFKPLPGEEGYRRAVAISAAEMQRREDAYGATNWYDWAILHWGTKWPAYEVGEWQTRDGYLARISFNTAWSDPREVFDAIADRFPAVAIEVHCGGEVDQPFSYRIDARADA